MDLIKIREPRMTTFIKAKLKESDSQTNIDKYKMYVHQIVLQNVISKQKIDFFIIKTLKMDLQI